MTKLPGRIFAMTFAIIFFASAAAFAVFVIYDTVQSHKDSSDAASDVTANANCPQDTATEAALKKPEIYKTSEKVTSLQLKDLTAGKGAAAKAGDCLVVKYYGTLATNGKMFDQNYTEKTGFAFSLGQSQVIEGWDKGLVGMKPGGVRRLVIPAAQAYADTSPSEAIPANSDLVFVVKLLRIES